jgi:hypothetical protein
MRWTLTAALGACAACGSQDERPPDPQPRWLEDLGAPPPTHLSEVGLFRDMATREPHPDLAPYEPRHGLYSNGLGKERLAFLPGIIDDADPSGWRFPDGTVLAKTFLHDDAPVETRLLFLGQEGWDYALYVWDGAEGVLSEGNWPEQPLDLGEVQHTLPGRLDCRTCHETAEESTGTPVLGIGPLQTAEDLAVGFAADPATEELGGRTPEEDAALGYFVGNCITCHTGGEAVNASFSLHPAEAVDNTLDQPTQSETGVGIRVVGGSPEESVLYETVVHAHRADYDGPFKAMPPLGVQQTDPDAEPILRAWIEAL